MYSLGENNGKGNVFYYLCSLTSSPTGKLPVDGGSAAEGLPLPGAGGDGGEDGHIPAGAGEGQAGQKPIRHSQ